MQGEVEDEQRRICIKHQSDFSPVLENEIAGFALSTRSQIPINGLRHPPTDSTTGWYIWCGTVLSEAPDFFKPICVGHLVEDAPEAVKFLALSPGHRFLTDGQYADVWFDQTLIEIE
jgi:hypothetical protein